MITKDEYSQLELRHSLDKFNSNAVIPDQDENCHVVVSINTFQKNVGVNVIDQIPLFNL